MGTNFTSIHCFFLLHGVVGKATTRIVRVDGNGLDL